MAPLLACALLVAVELLLVGAAAPGWAHEDGVRERLSERQLRRVETRILGASHAAEHAVSRRVEGRARLRWRRLSPERRRAALQVRRPSAADNPATDGRWNGQIRIPVMGIHAALLPTGKVMWFARPDADSPENQSIAYLWDPTKPANDPSALKRVDPPISPDTGRPVNLYCAGQSLLADGQLLVVGGTLAYAKSGVNDWQGVRRIYTFDPWSETWAEQPSMAHGRWYPTLTLLPDGRTLMTSGRDETGERINAEIEVFTPPSTRGGQGSVAKLGDYGVRLPGSPAEPYYYPHWFVMPSGSVLNAGPLPQESWSLRLTGDTLTSADRPPWRRQHLYGAGVLLPGGPLGSTRVAQIGGFGAPATGGEASEVTEIFDEAHPSSAPTTGASLAQPRAHHNTVLLPDGSMVTIGGGYGFRAGDLRLSGPEHRRIEIWDPAASVWRLGPAQIYKRAYHSTALLLPDGRVVSAGDDRDPAKDPRRQTDIAELYEPAYLFAPGPRPQITAGPQDISWNETFSIATDTSVARAVLVAPGATTHANDMHQRHVELRITPTAGGATLTAPPDANVAPPGHYMLFALSPTGKPSVARWIRLGTAPATVPPPPAPPPALKDTTAPRLLRLRPSTSLARALRGGLRVRIRTDEAGTATVTLTLDRAAARKLALPRRGKQRTRIGRAQTAVPRGPSTVVVKLTARARRAMRKVRRLRVRVAVNITDTGGNASRARVTVVLRGGRRT